MSHSRVCVAGAISCESSARCGARWERARVVQASARKCRRNFSIAPNLYRFHLAQRHIALARATCCSGSLLTLAQIEAGAKKVSWADHFHIAADRVVHKLSSHTSTLIVRPRLGGGGGDAMQLGARFRFLAGKHGQHVEMQAPGRCERECANCPALSAGGGLSSPMSSVQATGRSIGCRGESALSSSPAPECHQGARMRALAIDQSDGAPRPVAGCARGRE